MLIREYFSSAQHITNNNLDTHILNKLLAILNQQTKEITSPGTTLIELWVFFTFFFIPFGSEHAQQQIVTQPPPQSK